jgi:hypothetical protein
MIHYALRCGGGHEFDGWFKDSASFDEQSAGGLLDCPICADKAVQRALIAPRLRTGRAAAAPAEPVSPTQVLSSPAPQADAASTQAEPSKAVAVPPRDRAQAMPDQVRAMLQRVRAEVEKSCEYVGPRFATAARRMHDGDEAPRPIYGEATPDEAAMLAEDGIDVASIPWVPRADG